MEVQNKEELALEIVTGRVYKNKKHGTFYVVIGFTRHSENQGVLVMYQRVEMKYREDMPWSRPIELFKEKFEEVR